MGAAASLNGAGVRSRAPATHHGAARGRGTVPAAPRDGGAVGPFGGESRYGAPS
jgi:hypothetical protein